MKRTERFGTLSVIRREHKQEFALRNEIHTENILYTVRKISLKLKVLLLNK
jgi:hypothetical protein